MNASFKKRCISYLIDLIIIGLLLGIIMGIKEKDEKVSGLRSDLNIVTELYGNNEIKFPEYFERSTMISQQIDQECVIYTIFNIVFILGYFVLIPYFWNGQTVGKKIMNIKVVSSVSEKASLVQYLIRNSICNGLGYMILILLFLYLLPNKMYFAFEAILSFIQIILVIICIFMILYRKDKKGLHDILSGTSVKMKEVNL